MTSPARHLFPSSVPTYTARRRRHRLRRTALAALLVLVVAGAAFWSLVVPGLIRQTDSIPTRVRLVLRAHHVQYTPLSRISPFMQHAIVAVEDRRFYTDHGIDLYSMARAFVTDIRTWNFGEGGATITDQLVERTVPLQGNAVLRGVRIVLLAVTAYAHLGKSRVLDLYLNAVYYGRGAYGVAAAARTYFHRSPAQLTIGQAAFLAALPQAPSYYGAHPFAPVTQGRWRTVIHDMAQQGYISPARARAALQQGLQLQ